MSTAHAGTPTLASPAVPNFRRVSRRLGLVDLALGGSLVLLAAAPTLASFGAALLVGAAACAAGRACWPGAHAPM